MSLGYLRSCLLKKRREGGIAKGGGGKEGEEEEKAKGKKRGNSFLFPRPGSYTQRSTPTAKEAGEGEGNTGRAHTFTYLPGKRPIPQTAH